MSASSTGMRATPDVVVTFPTTRSALTAEAACKEAQVLGRLIPLPPALGAGCGMAWALDADALPTFLALAEKRNLMYEEVCDMREPSAERSGSCS